MKTKSILSKIVYNRNVFPRDNTDIYSASWAKLNYLLQWPLLERENNMHGQEETRRICKKKI